MLRLLHWGTARALWLDEARLAVNVCGRSYRELLLPLSLAQTAAPGFLWAERLATQVAGPGEAALRTLPLLAGITLPAGVWLVGRRLVGVRAALLAAATVATSFLFIYYSTEAKQYEVDAAITLLLVAAASYVRQGPTSSPRWVALMTAGVVAIWTSQPAVFVLAAIVGAFAIDRGMRSAPRGSRRIATMAAAWFVALAPLLVVTYRGAGSSAYLRLAWLGGFLSPFAPGFASRVRLALWGLMSTLLSPAVGQSSLVVLTFAAVTGLGVAAIWRRFGRTPALLTVGPIAVTVAAAILGRYPIAHRLVLFLGPLVCLSVAAGAVWVVDHAPALARQAAYAVLWVVVLVVGVRPAVADAVMADRSDGARTLAAEVLRSPRNAPVYVEARGAPTWLFYSTPWNRPPASRDTARVTRVTRWLDVGGDAFTDRPSRLHTVVQEGQRLHDVVGGREELFGVSTGMMNVYGIGWLTPNPDTGWAENEARRLRRAAHPDIWIFATNALPPQLDPLLLAVHAAGGRIAAADVDGDAALYLIRFGRSAG